MTDPRAKSLSMLRPPSPLPYVSRKALARVKDVLPSPTDCPYCQGPIQLVNNSEVYWGRSYGSWPYIYLCRPCDAYVGLHPDTDLPLGTMAGRSLREARKAGKNLFIQLSKQRRWSRNQAYTWLAEATGIPKKQCHWAWFDIQQCLIAADACRKGLST